MHIRGASISHSRVRIHASLHETLVRSAFRFECTTYDIHFLGHKRRLLKVTSHYWQMDFRYFLYLFLLQYIWRRKHSLSSMILDAYPEIKNGLGTSVCLYM